VLVARRFPCVVAALAVACSQVALLSPCDADSDTAVMGRLVFYPLAIGLFLLADMALRAHGH
jgi:hypothetical protein